MTAPHFAIEANAFYNCSKLTTAILNNGLEEIGERVFRGCTLVRINIPPLDRAIKDHEFDHCSGLTTAILNDGLEEIGAGAFGGCALVRINIPLPSGRSGLMHSAIAQD